MRLAISADDAAAPGERRIEIVERKGLGHPDSVCDALAEAFSLELSRYERERFGRILHHNVDKVLLAAGAAAPRFGGGSVVEPMRLFLAGRASLGAAERRERIDELAEAAARRWLAQHLHALDVDRHVAIASLVRPGSGELVELFEAREGRHLCANDTSCGVGYAPLSEVERLVLAVEQALNSDAVREQDPALGEDVKVMAVRHDDEIELTVACAMVDSALNDLADYVKARERVAELARRAAAAVSERPLTVDVNAGDDLSAERIYLTVTGTSAEAGDDGQTGRGNRVNGLITPGRPMTMESVAGKNPVTHVGKLYNLSAGLAAERLVAELPEVHGVDCALVSRIGCPVDEPQIVEVRVRGGDPHRDPALRREIERIVRDELQRIPGLVEELVRGELEVFRWPLRG